MLYDDHYVMLPVPPDAEDRFQAYEATRWGDPLTRRVYAVLWPAALFSLEMVMRLVPRLPAEQWHEPTADNVSITLDFLCHLGLVKKWYGEDLDGMLA